MDAEIEKKKRDSDRSKEFRDASGRGTRTPRANYLLRRDFNRAEIEGPRSTCGRKEREIAKRRWR